MTKKRKVSTKNYNSGFFDVYSRLIWVKVISVKRSLQILYLIANIITQWEVRLYFFEKVFYCNRIWFAFFLFLRAKKRGNKISMLSWSNLFRQQKTAFREMGKIHAKLNNFFFFWSSLDHCVKVSLAQKSFNVQNIFVFFQQYWVLLLIETQRLHAKQKNQVKFGHYEIVLHS